MSLIRKVVILV